LVFKGLMGLELRTLQL